jgi:hypothetical protein
MSNGAPKESGVANALAGVIENPAPLTRQEFEGYIDKHECARRLGRTVRSVDTYMAVGLIPFYKLGRTVAFKWSEVDAHIKAHCRVGVGGR